MFGQKHLEIVFFLFLQTQSIEFMCATSKSDLGDEPKLTKSKNTYLCLHVLPFGIKAAFEVVVDEMVTLTVRRSFEALKTQGNDVFIQVQNSSILSNMVVT